MKLVKKWLFPALVCLIVVGAAVLPPYLSRLRDAKQFGQSHTEALAAETLPVREEPTLLDRLALYVHWMDRKEIVPSFQSPEENRQEEAAGLAWTALKQLAQAEVIPDKLLQSPSGGSEFPYITSWTYILLWNPEGGVAGQAPVGLWRVTAELGDTCVMGMDIDQESGLPIRLTLYDPELGQWLAWKDSAAQAAVGRGFLSLLGLEGQAAQQPYAETPGTTVLPVADAEFYCEVTLAKNQLIVEFRPDWELTDG